MSAQANAREAADSTLLELLRRHAEPLPHIDTPMFGALFDRYANAKVVLIGESSHGTREFYRTRAAITASDRAARLQHRGRGSRLARCGPARSQGQGIDPMPVQTRLSAAFPAGCGATPR